MPESLLNFYPFQCPVSGSQQYRMVNNLTIRDIYRQFGQTLQTAGVYGMTNISLVEKGLRHSPGIKAMAVLIVLALSFATFALCIGNSPGAEGSEVKVNTWGELKDALVNGEVELISVESDIELDEDSDEPEIDHRVVTIELNGHTIKGNHFKDSKYEGRFFYVGDMAFVTIQNGTIDTGFDDDGGCAYVEKDGSLQLIEVVINNCGSSDDGGAIFVDGGLLTMYGGAINSCDSYDNAGAIYADNEALIELNDVKLEGNTADGHGGAIEIIGAAKLIASGCHFEGNYCEDEGGAIYFEERSEKEKSENKIINCKFIENGTFQGDCGGAIYVKDNVVIINSTSFQENEAGADGGAIFLTESEVYIDSADFKDNRAANDDCQGGAIYVDDDSRLNLKNCNIIGNRAASNGGGIMVADDDDIALKIENSVVIKDNKLGSWTEVFSDSNLRIDSDSVIECGPIDDTTEIWLSLKNGDRVFTSQFKQYGHEKDPAVFFKSDDTNRYVAADPDTGEAKLYGGSAGDMSDDNTMIIAAVIAVIAVILIAGGAYFYYKKKNA